MQTVTLRRRAAWFVVVVVVLPLLVGALPVQRSIRVAATDALEQPDPGPHARGGHRHRDGYRAGGPGTLVLTTEDDDRDRRLHRRPATQPRADGDPAFTEDDLRAVCTFASQAGIAIENVLLAP